MKDIIIGDNSVQRYNYNNIFDSPNKNGIYCHICNPKWGYMIHRHDYIEIEYLVEGKIVHELNGVRHTLSVGDGYGLSQRDLHSINIIEPVVIHNISIYIKEAPHSIQKLLSKIKFPFMFHLDKENAQKIDFIFFYLINTLNNQDDFSNEITISLLTLIVAELFKLSEPVNSANLPKGYDYIEQTLKYIENNFSNPISLITASENIHLSPNYLSKIFSEITGVSFSEYLSKVRVEKARVSLLNSEKSVTEIAFDCGFNSFSTFSRKFKSTYGCPPSNYRYNYK